MVIDYGVHETDSADDERPAGSTFDSRAKVKTTVSNRALHSRFLAWNNALCAAGAVPCRNRAGQPASLLAVLDGSSRSEHEPSMPQDGRDVPGGSDRAADGTSKAEEGGGSSLSMTGGTGGEERRLCRRPRLVPPAGFEPAIFTLKG